MNVAAASRMELDASHSFSRRPIGSFWITAFTTSLSEKSGVRCFIFLKLKVCISILPASIVFIQKRNAPALPSQRNPSCNTPACALSIPYAFYPKSRLIWFIAANKGYVGELAF
jgi:hypothetical protein